MASQFTPSVTIDGLRYLLTRADTLNESVGVAEQIVCVGKGCPAMSWKDPGAAHQFLGWVGKPYILPEAVYLPKWDTPEQFHQIHSMPSPVTSVISLQAV